MKKQFFIPILFVVLALSCTKKDDVQPNETTVSKTENVAKNPEVIVTYNNISQNPFDSLHEERFNKIVYFLDSIEEAGTFDWDDMIDYVYSDFNSENRMTLSNISRPANAVAEYNLQTELESLVTSELISTSGFDTLSSFLNSINFGEEDFLVTKNISETQDEVETFVTNIASSSNYSNQEKMIFYQISGSVNIWASLNPSLKWTDCLEVAAGYAGVIGGVATTPVGWGAVIAGAASVVANASGCQETLDSL